MEFVVGADVDVVDYTHESIVVHVVEAEIGMELNIV